MPPHPEAHKGHGELVPKHIRCAGQILRFEAVFNEAIAESRLETFRRRFVVIRYHLEDDTVDIQELKRKNDGIDGTQFLRRMELPDVSVESLCVGTNLTIYGRTMRIIKCDEFTRHYYEEIGREQPENEDKPTDAFGETMASTEARKTTFHGKQMSSMKRFIEAVRGAPPRDTAAFRNRLEYDGVDLHFYLQWQNPPEDVFTTKPCFVLTYHMATAEMDVRWKREDSNIGSTVLLRSQKVPFKWMGHDDRARSCEPGNGDEDYYHHNDLLVGTTINILGRDMLIYDCDDFTQQWYQDNCGVDQQAHSISFATEPAPAPVQQPPPSTGFGSDEDSLQSWKHLVPKPPRPRPRRTEWEGKFLKFTAKQVTDNVVDSIRRYRICYFLEDDTIAIFEQPIRNTGLVGGKWASRTRLQNREAKRPFTMGDFFVGADLYLNAHHMRVISADRPTLEFMEDHTDVWPAANVEDAAEAVQRAVSAAGPGIGDILHRELGKDLVPFEDVVDAFSRAGVSVHPQQIATVAHACEEAGEHEVPRGSLLRVALGQTPVPAPRRVAAGSSTEASIASRIASADPATQAVLHLLARRMLQSRFASRLHESFRVADRRQLHTVSFADFRTIMQDVFGLDEDSVERLERFFVPPGAHEVPYLEVLETIHADRETLTVPSSHS